MNRNRGCLTLASWREKNSLSNYTYITCSLIRFRLLTARSHWSHLNSFFCHMVSQPIALGKFDHIKFAFDYLKITDITLTRKVLALCFCNMCYLRVCAFMLNMPQTRQTNCNLLMNRGHVADQILSNVATKITMSPFKYSVTWSLTNFICRARDVVCHYRNVPH